MSNEEAFTFKIPENWERRKIWFYLSVIAIIFIVILGVYIRTVNIPQLKDTTTGEYTLGPDLDPFLYLRLASNIVETGHLPFPDEMRYLGMGFFYKNFMPFYIAYSYKIMSFFYQDISLEYVAIIFPVIAFGLSIFIFFFFVREIFYNKNEFEKNSLAVLSTLLYSVIPQMQHRTVAGIPELESAGLIFFWMSFFLFLRAWNSNNDKIFRINKKYILGFLAGLSTSLMIYTWGGFRFIFLSIALATLIVFFLGNIKKEETVVYSLWFIISCATLISWVGLYVTLFDLTTFVPAFFVFLLLWVNHFFGKIIGERARLITKKNWFSDELSCFLLVIIFGFIGLLLIKPNFALGIFNELIGRLLHPYGETRVQLTVSENLQPYTVSLIGQFGKEFFWMFFFGIFILFYDTFKDLKKIHKAILLPSFLLFLTAFVFSRYSSDSLFNGENFVSQLFYFGSMIFFLFSIIYIYIKDSKNTEKANELNTISYNSVFLISLTLLMFLASKGAIRLLFISSPVFTICVAFLPIIFFSYWMKTKDDLWKIFLIILILISAFFFVKVFMSYEKITLYSTEQTIPSEYTIQWQNAMSWVRDETPKDAIFVHWWDYGYWIQTIGQRPTVTDGGHLIGYWDHLIGRYLLTTPFPETALSLMKTYGVSYLLIDQTDLGKYSAYSIIGSDTNNRDRASQLGLMTVNPSQTKETLNETTKIYQGIGPVDEDIVYNQEGESLLLPKEKAFFAGMILKSLQEGNSISLYQPVGIFIYNGKQINIPIRYLYHSGKMNDFGSGLDSVIQIIPQVNQNGGQVNFDELGAAIYLSPKVSKSLFAQLYLLDDPFNKYSTIKLTHSENDLLVEHLNSQGANIKDFVYFNGFRGPIKIWKVDYPNNVISHEEFLSTEGSYAQFDNLTFSN